MGAEDGDFRGLGLTSRRNLCLHPEVCYDTPDGAQRADMNRSVKRRKARLSIQDVEI